MDIRRILVPTDFSRCSKSALFHAQDMARRFGAKLDVLFVWDLPALFSYEMAYAFPGNEGRSIEELLEEDGRTQLDALARHLVPDVIGRTTVVRGEPWREIVKQAKSGDYELIVMGTHGRTGVERALIGRVTERVVQHAPCPVLSVRTNPDEPRRETET